MKKTKQVLISFFDLSFDLSFDFIFTSIDNFSDFLQDFWGPFNCFSPAEKVFHSSILARRKELGSFSIKFRWSKDMCSQMHHMHMQCRIKILIQEQVNIPNRKANICGHTAWWGKSSFCNGISTLSCVDENLDFEC